VEIAGDSTGASSPIKFSLVSTINFSTACTTRSLKTVLSERSSSSTALSPKDLASAMTNHSQLQISKSEPIHEYFEQFEEARRLTLSKFEMRLRLEDIQSQLEESKRSNLLMTVNRPARQFPLLVLPQL
jgi:hypothetical protein